MILQIRQTFKTDFVSVHNLWRKSHYAWLPTRSEIPKELGEELDKEHLDKLDVRDIINNISLYRFIYLRSVIANNLLKYNNLLKIFLTNIYIYFF